MIDEYIRDLNQTNFDDKTWRDNGIEAALDYEEAKEKERKEFDERSIEAKRPTRSRF
jgi:hypothetical protein